MQIRKFGLVAIQAAQGLDEMPSPGDITPGGQCRGRPGAGLHPVGQRLVAEAPEPVDALGIPFVTIDPP